MFLLGPVFFIVLTVATSSPIPESRIGLTPAVEPFAGVEYLLPTNVVPQKYVLRLKPNLSGDFAFSGEMTMTVQVTTATNTITFHTNDMNVASVTVTNIDTDSVVQVTNQVYLETYDFYTLTLESVAAVGNYEIYVAYTGYHKDDMRGFYRSSYVNSNNEKVWLASTHFEPVRARRAFPCFDEPALKARFQISIAVPEGLHAIANMPRNTSAIDNGEEGLDWYHFEETPMPMSTYLVAFVVSDFEKTSEDSVSIWHRPGLQSQALYSASISPKIIDKLEEFTGVSYHLPKMDEVAVPDFSAGAMENWGLVTYRERALLFEEGVSTSSYKQSIATVIAHEFGHQWFGDLVGPRWWSYLWLNEGFATYFEFFATALVETTWRLEEQFVVREVHSAFSADASEWSHPMTYDVYSPTEIGDIFDSISYAKAGSVIRMMEHILTTDTFKGGLNLYLNTNGNLTAEADDLFKALEEQYKEDFPNSDLSDEDLQDVFESWTLQMGYPVITVTRDYALGTVNVNQERFLLTESSSSTDDHDYKWWVPLTFTTKTEKDFTDTTTKEWLKRTEENKQLTTLTPLTSDWVIFNIQQTGFYRVNYDTTNWKLLISQLNSDQYEVIPPVNRAQLLDDAFNLARAGLLDYSTLFSLTDYLARETDYIPWYAAFNGFSFLNTRLNKASDSEYSVFKNYVLSLLEKAYTTLGFEEKTTDGHVDRLNRNLILTWACRLGHADCIQKAIQHFNAFVSDQNANKIAPDLQSVVYCNGLGNSDGAGFDVLWEKAQSTEVSTEQVLILGILGCTAHEDSVHKYINQSYSEETPIRQQDISLVLSSVTSYGNVDFLTSYIQKHYQDRSPSQVRSLISTAANLLRSEDQYSKLEDFVQSNKVYLEVTDEQATSLLSSYHSNKAWATTTGSTILTQVKQQIYRLPTTISPVNYVIRLTPHLEEDRFNFDGEVTITINVAEYTNQIVLHASDMVVDTAATQVANSGGTVQTISSHETNELRETYTITLVDSLVVGQQYNVYIKFLGNLQDDMYGFYMSYYTVGGAKRWLASTQFEPTYARRAFPCFDEPALKATFQINIGRPSTYTSVSNMKIESTDTSDPNLVWDIYKTTPVMSTYLLAFLVSDFEKTENDAQDTSVWHRADAASQASYSIGVSRPLIDAMVAFTGVTFELEKMDQAAIPDFSAGAMENWGLVTYRERLILFDENVSTSADKQGIATTIAHEFAHQWFGNLVSPRWWSYTWLNEGFATYFEWFITAEVEKDWRIEDQFVIKEVQVALAADCLESSHPMTNLVNSPADISSIFDSISYAKAGSVIRMMSHFLSTSIFKAGLNTYLNAHHHNTAEASDLFTALHSSFLTVNPTSEISVIDVMNTWTTQMGYPVITVNRNYDTARTAKVKQERFLLTASADSSDNHDYKWWVPLTFTTNTSKDFTTTQTQIWLKASENETDLTDIAANDDWVIFNKQQIGFYRVNYDDTNWNLIISHLNSDQFTDIHVLNRAQLLDDSLNLARAGILDYTTALNITKYLSREDDYIPWYSAFTAFSFLDARLIGVEEEYQLFKTYLLSLIENVYNDLGFEEKANETHTDKLLRNLVLTWACNLGLESCVSAAKEKLAQKIASPSTVTIAADVSSVVYCTALREGGEEEWTFLKAQYDSSNVGTEQVLLLTALGCSTGTQIITNYLDLSISADSGIRKQDASRVFSAVYANPSGVDIAFQFLTENYQKISEFYGGLGTIGSILKGIAGRISTQEQLVKLQSFVAENEAALGDAVPASKQAIETAQANLDWFASNRAALVTWLREHSPAAPEVTTLFIPTTTQGATCITISTTLIVLASLVAYWRGNP